MRRLSSLRCRAMAPGSHAALALALITLADPSARAATIRVPADQPTIQAGIDAAAPGDTVLVAPGTYAGPGNRDLSFGGTDLVLRSSGGLGVTVIDCHAQGRALLFQNGETAAAVVEGFTIHNGLADGTYGGGVLIEGGATPTMAGCRFLTNHANAGGAIHVTSGATLSDCEFEGNTADNYGGGVYGAGASLELSGCSFTENGAGIGAGMYVILGSTVEIADCGFTENAPLNEAGGVYASASTLTLRRSSFVGNTGNHGGGVYLEGGTASVDSCTFRMNTVAYGGGGMYGEEVQGFTLTRSTFEGNTTLSSGSEAGGGGLRVYGDGLAITDCSFIGNRAIGSGGGGMRTSAPEPFERCTFIDNHADGNGGGATCGGRARDCVFEGNISGGSGGGKEGGEELIDCRFADNHAGGRGGGANASGAALVIRCEFSGNTAVSYGGGLYRGSLSSGRIEDCRFSDNSAASGGALRVYTYAGYPASVAACAFERNTAFSGGAVAVDGDEEPAPVTFSGCTLVGNGSPAGTFYLQIPVAIENTIIAYGTEGEAVACNGNGLGIMSCTDIYGNAGGDWTGCISDQLGINGNFSADPLFCNVGGGDYTLAETSPCAPEHSPAGCGLIGAFPVACVNPIGVAVEGAPPVAGRLRVAPNPMRGSGTIEWVNNAHGAVSLRLYDPLGRLVTSRFLGFVPEGRQELRWDGLVGDRRLPRGVYLLELGGPSGGVDRARVIVIR